MNKLQMAERRQRLINQGIPEHQVDEHIKKREWVKMSDDNKIKQLRNELEVLKKSIIIAHENLSKDMIGLHTNDRVIADSTDINLIAISKMFERLGVSKEDQASIIEDARVQFEAKIEKRETTEEQKRELENISNG